MADFIDEQMAGYGFADTFRAKLTASVFGSGLSGLYTYDWSEYVEQNDGTLVAASTPRNGSKTTGPFLVELNNVQVTPLPVVVNARYRGMLNGSPMYDFQATGSSTASASPGGPQFAVQSNNPPGTFAGDSTFLHLSNGVVLISNVAPSAGDLFIDSSSTASFSAGSELGAIDFSANQSSVGNIIVTAAAVSTGVPVSAQMDCYTRTSDITHLALRMSDASVYLGSGSGMSYIQIGGGAGHNFNFASVGFFYNESNGGTFAIGANHNFTVTYDGLGDCIMTFGNQNTDSVGFFGASPIHQQSAIAHPAGGATVDTQARTAIVAILNLLGAASGGYGLTA